METKRNAQCDIRMLLIITLSAVFCAAPGAAAQDGDTYVPSGVISWWPGDGNARDIAGGRDGALVNNVRFMQGEVDQAFSFDGSSYVSVPDDPIWTLGQHDFTIELWVNFDSVRSRSPFISHDESGGHYNKWIFWYDSRGHDKPSGPALRFHTTSRTLPSIDTVYAPWSPATDRWYHVAVTRSDNTYALYIDGTEVARNVDTTTIPDPATAIRIGKAEAYNLDGLIDEVRLYDRALFQSEIGRIVSGYTGPMILYVDDDAPADLGPSDSVIGDPLEDGSREHPFDMIQEGINVAIDGDTVVVLDGTYWETIDFKGKSIVVTSMEPSVSGQETLAYPVIDAGDNGTGVVFANGESEETVLEGFTITRGRATWTGGVLCNGSSPAIRNCLIVGNRSVGQSDRSGSAVCCIESHATFVNCTISGNAGGMAAIAVDSLSQNLFQNCIIWDNEPFAFSVSSTSLGGSGGIHPIVVYSDILVDSPLDMNLKVDPAFALPGYWADPRDLGVEVDPSVSDAVWVEGDYHLMSTQGRWDPITGTWVPDEIASPCIDKGDPDSPWSDEPEPNGECINMGAYGGTSQASMTQIECCLTITATEGGRVILPDVVDGVVESGQTRTFCFGCGETATFVVQSDPNHYLVDLGSGWTGVTDPGDPNGQTYTIVVDSDIAVTTTHAEIGSAGHGSVSCPDGPPSVSNSCVRVVAEPDPCYHFAGWTGTAVDAGKVADANAADITVCVDADYTLIANFAPDTPTLTLASSAGGSVTIPGEGEFIYDCNEVVNVLAVPEPCYHFVNWTGTAAEAGRVGDVNSPNTTVAVDADYTLHANFTLDEPTLTISSTAGGSVTEPGEGEFTYDCGASVPVLAVPDDCYEFTSWTGTAVDAGKVADPNDPNTIVTVDADYTLEATFAQIEYTLDISSTEHGSVTTPGEGVFTYDCGAEVSVTATADTYAYFIEWMGTAVDAGKVANPNTAQTTVTVDGTYTLEAVFGINQYTISFDSTDGGYVYLWAKYPGTWPAWFDPQTLTFDHGTNILFKAVPEPGYKFSHWSGTIYSTAIYLFFPVDQDHRITANFVPIEE